MTEISFNRPTPKLLSMNDRHHWRRTAADIAEWRRAAKIVALNKAGHIEQDPALVVVTLDVPDRRRRDPANYFPCVKAIVDGLVDAGWWPDDTPQYVTVAEPVLRPPAHGETRPGVPSRRPLQVSVELRPR